MENILHIVVVWKPPRITYHLSHLASLARRRIHDRPAPETASLLARSCAPGPAAEREYFSLSTSRNSGVPKIPGTRKTGLFISEADLQAWKSLRERVYVREKKREKGRDSLFSGPSRRRERVPFIANDTRTGCIKEVIVSSGIFIRSMVQP